MTSIIVIENWDRHQHYKDRDPPWIKLYRDLLTTESWVLGTDCSRLVQVAITLLAARYQNATPYNFALLKKVASLDCSAKQFDDAIRHLCACGFLKLVSNQQVTKQEENVAQHASTTLATCNTEAEQSRAEQSRAEQIPPSAAPTARTGSTGNDLEKLAADLGIDPTDVLRVFAHWQAEWGHPQAKLDDKRRKLIRQRLRDYPAETLCAAISGYRNSPHHCGQNERATTYDDIGLFLRDSAHVDAGLRFAAQPKKAVSGWE